MSGWDKLRGELAAWGDDGRRAVFWWRDDDASEPRASLDRLLELRTAFDLPLCLAVIPGLAGESLAERLRDREALSLLQHGYRHQDHSRPDEKKIELGGARKPQDTLSDLAAGMTAGRALFGDDWLPVLVPPWNRISQGIAESLPALGFRGLSTHGRRPSPPAGLVQVNSHLDILAWRPSPRFAGEEFLLQQLLEGLRSRRLEDPPGKEEPLGILTHHRAHDAASWRFLESLFSWLAGQETVSWKGAMPLFFPGEGGEEG